MQIDVILYDPETDQELEITAEGYMRKAEPDVGIQSDYMEVDCAYFHSVWGDWIFNPTEYAFIQIDEQCYEGLRDVREAMRWAR